MSAFDLKRTFDCAEKARGQGLLRQYKFGRLRETGSKPFNARMRTRLVPTVRKLYADRDTVVAFFDAQGTARDGETYANTYAWILEMKSGKIVRSHAFFDSIAFDAFWKRVPEQPTAE